MKKLICLVAFLATLTIAEYKLNPESLVRGYIAKGQTYARVLTVPVTQAKAYAKPFFSFSANQSMPLNQAVATGTTEVSVNTQKINLQKGKTIAARFNASSHMGDFSQDQLPETALNFYPRAYSPTNVEAFASTSVPTGRKPNEIYYAYGIDKVTPTGAGQTIAIVVPAGSETLVNDLHVFSQQFGLPDASIQFIYPQGVPTTHSDSWALETSLDAEWAHAAAPGAKLLMVICNTSAISGLVQGIDAAVAAGAKIISLSWGSVEWSNQMSYDSHLNINGVTIVAATGDSGYGTSWPSVQPHLIAVGGTQLVSSGTSGTVVETAWSHGSGGISKYYSKPSYQSKVQNTLFRTTPDTSLNASGYTIYMGNYQSQKGYINVSGTSAAAPITAGLIARGYATRTLPLPSDLHLNLYTNPTSFYRDITTGSNGVAATVGYDYDTGLGVPVAPAFVNAVSK